jgi:hypothetical protein
LPRRLTTDDSDSNRLATVTVHDFLPPTNSLAELIEALGTVSPCTLISHDFDAPIISAPKNTTKSLPLIITKSR